MNNYPEAVAKISNDYLERVKSQLRLVPSRERDEFLREIESHVYEAYQQTSGEDDIAKILIVLRNLGEPAEVVADRLPAAMVRSGTGRNLPLHIVGGIVIALFGIPLGFGGVAALVGILVALGGILAAYYVTVGAVFLTSTLFMLLGLARLYPPGLWDRLVTLGVIQIHGPLAEFLNQVAPSSQGFFMIVFASVLAVTGLGMARLGRYLVRGLRFLFSL